MGECVHTGVFLLNPRPGLASPCALCLPQPDGERPGRGGAQPASAQRNQGEPGRSARPLLPTSPSRGGLRREGRRRARGGRVGPPVAACLPPCLPPPLPASLPPPPSQQRPQPLARLHTKAKCPPSSQAAPLGLRLARPKPGRSRREERGEEGGREARAGGGSGRGEEERGRKGERGTEMERGRAPFPPLP